MKPCKFICGCTGIGEITYTVEDSIRYYHAFCKKCGRANTGALAVTELLYGIINLEQVTVEELAASFGGELMYDYF